MSLIENHQENSLTYLKTLRELRYFNGLPADFWSKLLDSLGQYSGSEKVVLLVMDNNTEEWRHLRAWPSSVMRLRKDSAEMVQMGLVADQAQAEEICIDYGTSTRSDAPVTLGFSLELGDAKSRGSLVFLIPRLSAVEIEQLAQRLQLLMDIPANYQMNRALQQARIDVVQFADAIDLMTLLNESDRFMSAAMTFCNELAVRHESDRVSLGWLESSYVRVQAISHMEKFEKKMAAVQSLEAAMEEAFDQDEELVWPKTEDQNAVDRDHEHYANEQSLSNLVSLPIRIDDQNIGVVTLEREKRSFDNDEVRGLRLVLDQASRHLYQLKRHDRWFGARFVTWLKERLEWFVGPEQTFAKATGVLVTVILAFVLFGSWSYRVEAPFILRSDEVAFVPAPIDGYVKEVQVEIGDLVNRGDILVTLDTRELVLDEAMALADISRYSREMEKSRAQNALADMRIAAALVAQSEAELAKVRYHIKNAEISATFDGVVVEGDLKEMLGAPVRKGDILFKVANIEKMYVELDLAERDIHEVIVDGTGQISFVSRPDQVFDIKVDEIDPAAVAKEQGNVFMLKASFEGEASNWWRPGMSGVAKIDVGDRNIFWILTHRTVDFFRMWLWW
ncbi:MAG: biotin carboxyl carrier protein [Candidatus Azotimanducaceae bacterium]|jgi:biotin carboxyl carrier protein